MSEGFGDQLGGLTRLLQAHQPLWQNRAFHQLRLPWEDDLPELAAHLRALDPERVAGLERDDAALLRELRPWLPWVRELQALTTLPACSAPVGIDAGHAPGVPPPALHRDVPGRKWAQIEAFATALAAPNETAARGDTGLPLLEWCAGKGHLGRYLSWRLRSHPVDSLEWQPGLVEAGRAMAARLALPQQLHCQDVMATDAARWLPGRHAVALHACGELHRQLVRLAPQQGLPALSLSPCCYHLGGADVYQPLSGVLANTTTDFLMTREALRTAVQESVTAPMRVRRQRETLQAWRLGFDLLQRQCRGEDAYLPTPPLEPAWLQRGFVAFCRHLAALKGVPLQNTSDAAIAAHEAPGWRRLHEVAALDLVRLLFRRPLEVWMVLDLCVYLQEHGYSVHLGTFCPRELTPRNLLLQAWA